MNAYTILFTSDIYLLLYSADGPLQYMSQFGMAVKQNVTKSIKVNSNKKQMNANVTFCFVSHCHPKQPAPLLITLVRLEYGSSKQKV